MQRRATACHNLQQRALTWTDVERRATACNNLQHRVPQRVSHPTYLADVFWLFHMLTIVYFDRFAFLTSSYFGIFCILYLVHFFLYFDKFEYDV